MASAAETDKHKAKPPIVSPLTLSYTHTGQLSLLTSAGERAIRQSTHTLSLSLSRTDIHTGANRKINRTPLAPVCLRPS